MLTIFLRVSSSFVRVPRYLRPKKLLLSPCSAFRGDYLIKLPKNVCQLYVVRSALCRRLVFCCPRGSRCQEASNFTSLSIITMKFSVTLYHYAASNSRTVWNTHDIKGTLKYKASWCVAVAYSGVNINRPHTAAGASVVAVYCISGGKH